MCKHKKVKILNNALDIAVENGHISIFSLLVLTLFERYNINNNNDLKNNKEISEILSKKIINKWIKRLQIQKISLLII